MNRISFGYFIFFIHEFFSSLFYTVIPLIIVNTYNNPNYLALYTSLVTLTSIFSGLIWTRIKNVDKIKVILINLITVVSFLFLFYFSKLINFYLFLVLILIVDELISGSYYLTFNYIVINRRGKLIDEINKIDITSRIANSFLLALLIVINKLLSSDLENISFYLALGFSITLALLLTYLYKNKVKRIVKGIVYEDSISILGLLDSFFERVEEKVISLNLFDYNSLSLLYTRFKPVSNFPKSIFYTIPKLEKLKNLLVLYIGVLIFLMGSGIMFPQLTYIFKNIYNYSDFDILVLNLVYGTISFLILYFIREKFINIDKIKVYWILRLIATLFFVFILNLTEKLLSFLVLNVIMIIYAITWSGFINPLTSFIVRKYGNIHKGYVDFFINLGYFLTSIISGLVLEKFGFIVNLFIAFFLFFFGGIIIIREVKVR